MPESSTGFAPINGAQLYYEIAGAGPPLVFVHAGIADSRMWNDQWAFFVQHVRALRYDLRGFGQSSPVDGAFSHHADLHELLRFHGIDRAYLVGCSRGGAVCIDFALEHPDHVAALALVCSAPSGMPYEDEPPPIWNEVITAFEAGDLERANELEVQIWVDGLLRAPGSVPRPIRERVRAMNAIALRNERMGGPEQALDPPAYTRIGEIRAPTLVITGALDVPPTQAAARLMLERIPGARQAVIDGTAHLPNMERPDEFNRVLAAFLGELT